MVRRLFDREPSPRLVRALWALFLVSLPVSSFPWLPGVVGGSTTVRPLAIYPLVPLIIYLVFFRLFRAKLPGALLPLLLFFVFVAASGALAVAEPTPMFRSVTPLDRVIRNLLTLALGIAFYLVATLVPRNRDDVDFSIRWLLIGFTAALAWSSLQGLYVLNIKSNPGLWEPFFDRMNAVHHMFSIRNLQEKRVTGLAYEPSWFAEQLSILVLPWLLVHSVRRRTVFRRRLGRFLVEDLLLAWTVAVMMLTFSRTGLTILLVLAGITILTGSGRPAGEGEGRIARILGSQRLRQRAGFFALVAAVFLVAVFAVGSNNRYFSRMWRYFTEEERRSNYWAYIAFGQRFIYWEAALEMYERRPLTGVGVGNFALHFEEAMPPIPLFQYPEILELIIPERGLNELVTPKNLFLRVLAETGLPGLGLLLGFWGAVLGEALTLTLRRREERDYDFGRAGLLGLAAAFLVAFSTDSFAMPNAWVLFGLVGAAARARGLDASPLPSAPFP